MQVVSLLAESLDKSLVELVMRYLSVGGSMSTSVVAGGEGSHALRRASSIR